jgi:hypothetical protein
MYICLYLSLHLNVLYIAFATFCGFILNVFILSCRFSIFLDIVGFAVFYIIIINIIMGNFGRIKKQLLTYTDLTNSIRE